MFNQNITSIGFAKKYSAKTKPIHRLTSRLMLCLALLVSHDAFAVNEIGTGSYRFVGVSYIGRVSQDIGGDSLFTASTDDGSNLELNAGDGTFLEAGVSLDWRLLQRTALQSEFAVGFKTSSEKINGGDLSAKRVIFSGTQFYRFSSGIRLGAGVVLHVSPKVEAAGNGFQTTTASLGSVIGPNVVLDYVGRSGFGGGLRATMLNYSDGENTFNANSLGLFVLWQI